MENKENQKPEEIKETELTVVKEPAWKKVLRYGGYFLTMAVGAVAGLLIGNHMGGDDDDSPSNEDTKE